MTKFEIEYLKNCKAWSDTIPAVIEMNRSVKKETKKEIDISEWFKFDRTFPAK